MPLLLVHVTHGGSTVDVAVPDDQPVERLLPQVIAALGAPADLRGWRLALQGSQATIDGRATLRDAAVAGGATLRLVSPLEKPRPAWGFPAATGNGAPLVAQPASNAAPQPAPASDAWPAPAPAAQPIPLLPDERTREILPRRLSRIARLGLALDAALRGGAADEPVAPPLSADSWHSPAALARADNPSPMLRARRRWRATDYLELLDGMIAGPRLTTCVTIAVVSPKGGVGKTTVTTLLGTLFAQLRRDRILAIDTNPDYGSLGRTLAPEHNVFVDDLLGVLDRPDLTATKLDANLARAHHGLLVLPAPTDPERMSRLDRVAYAKVIDGLKRLVAVILLDCGTGLWDPSARAALEAADQVILVSDAEPATASLVSEASEQLEPSGVPVILVVNRMSRGARLDVDSFASAVDWARALLTIADERTAARSISTRTFDWGTAPRSWRVATRELAAVLAADWVRLGLTL